MEVADHEVADSWKLDVGRSTSPRNKPPKPPIPIKRRSCPSAQVAWAQLAEYGACRHTPCRPGSLPMHRRTAQVINSGRDREVLADCTGSCQSRTCDGPTQSSLKNANDDQVAQTVALAVTEHRAPRVNVGEDVEDVMPRRQAVPARRPRGDRGTRTSAGTTAASHQLVRQQSRWQTRDRTAGRSWCRPCRSKQQHDRRCGQGRERASTPKMAEA